MKKLVKPIVFTLALTCVTCTVLAQCINMAGSKTDKKQTCINCAALTAKPNGTGCSYSRWNCNATTDCSLGQNPNIDWYNSGIVVTVIGSERTYSGGTCASAQCVGATGGPWVNQGAVNIWTSFDCGG
jgi:hypothetical protein